MKSVNYLCCLLLSSLASTAQAQYQSYLNIDPATDLNALPNNSLYLRWRPIYHVLAAGGHMNDPCGPMYDPGQKLYHIFYQSFPQHVQFGNTSWSHATSPDMVSWTDVTDWQNRSMVAIATGPYPTYDWIGAFSGGAQPVGLDGKADGNLTLMYTGASRFPDNWRLPYKLMTEQQAIATSSDGGRTWQKYAGNPVLDGAPGGWNVTGLRDPIFQQLPELDSVLGYQNGSNYYMIMGSGIREVGPRIPLYIAPSNDLTNWTFQGALWEVPNNYSFGGDPAMTGNHGYNYELAGLCALTERVANGGDGTTTHWVLTMGAEGPATTLHPITHWSLFTIGTMSKRANGSAEYNITASGVLDWGESYAMNQFYDPVHDRRVIWGWIDEDLNNQGVKAVGLQGSLGLPRELFIKVYNNVTAPAGGPPAAAAELWIPNTRGTYTVKTVGQKPLPEVVDAVQRNYTSVGQMQISNTTLLQAVNSTTLHMNFTINEVPSQGRFSVLLRASPNLEEYVNLTYYPSNSSVVWDRTKSTLLSNLQNSTLVSHFEPFTINNGTANTTESISMDIFVDGSLIEVFINERYALSSRSYPSLANSTGVGFDVDPANPVTVQNINVWQGMINVWPNRPANASSPLVYDKYYETHLTFPNPYVDEGYPIYDGWKRR